MALVRVEFNGPGDPDGSPSLPEAAAVIYPWLHGPFRHVRVACAGDRSTLIPAAVFDPEKPERYFHFNFLPSEEEKILADHIIPLEVWNVFGIPASLSSAASSLHPRERIVHLSSLLIESVWINYKNRIGEPRLYLHFRSPALDVLVFDGRGLRFFNTFTCSSAEEAGYYALFVMEQLELNPEAAPVMLLGDPAGHPGVRELLERYIRNVTEGGRNETYSYSRSFDGLPGGAFFPLLNIFSCGL